jgi:hypothetical protein
MFSQLSSLARSSILALAALASVPAAAPAAPLGPSFIPAVADSTTLKPTLVQGEGRDKSNPAYQVWRKNGLYGDRGRNFDGRGRNFDGGDRNFDGRGRDFYRGRDYGNDNNFYIRDRRHFRRHYRDNYYRQRSGIYFGLGIAPSYGDADPYYDGYYGDPYYSEPVYRPRVIQRRVYRSGGSAHVQWCYNRYRSYRAWDNTFQPYNGPRQQCYSPYS